jgi:hypothetical protein
VSKRIVKTTNIYPPIPVRQFDWQAWYADEGEESGNYGYGETEAKAIEDLRDKNDDSGEIPCEDCTKIRGYNYCTMNCYPRNVKRLFL